jgi:hypothetical protein
MRTEKGSENKTNGLNVRCSVAIWEQIELFRAQKSAELGIEISRSAAISMLISVGLKENLKHQVTNA